MRGVHHFHPPLLPGCSRIYKMTQKRVGHGRERWEKGNKKRSGKIINLLGRLVTEFLTNIAWLPMSVTYCMTMCTCISS